MCNSNGQERLQTWVRSNRRKSVAIVLITQPDALVITKNDIGAADARLRLPVTEESTPLAIDITVSGNIDRKSYSLCGAEIEST